MLDSWDDVFVLCQGTLRPASEQACAVLAQVCPTFWHQKWLDKMAALSVSTFSGQICPVQEDCRWEYPDCQCKIYQWWHQRTATGHASLELQCGVNFRAKTGIWRPKCNLLWPHTLLQTASEHLAYDDQGECKMWEGAEAASKTAPLLHKQTVLSLPGIQNGKCVAHFPEALGCDAICWLTIVVMQNLQQNATPAHDKAISAILICAQGNPYESCRKTKGSWEGLRTAWQVIQTK